MKKILLIHMLLISFLTYGQSNPFDKLKFDKVIAYEYQGNAGLSIEKCLAEEKEKIHKTKILTKKQIDQLEVILTSKESYGNITMACFDPHLGIVYYLKGKIVATISVCLSCNSLSSSEDIPATKLKMIKVSADYSYPANGFSKITRKRLYEYIKNLGFTKYLKPLRSYLDE